MSPITRRLPKVLFWTPVIALPVVSFCVSELEASASPPAPGYCGNSLFEIVFERGVPLMLICWDAAVVATIVNYFRDQLGTFD